MKILELNLKRFGPFADVALDLSGGNEGLHVVFGRNEAGKSTALRALIGLLFGIEHNTRDAFLHDMSQLRIGGRLRHSSGDEFAFVRKKGRTKTIVSPGDERPLDEAILRRFLSGVDRALFTSLYGIGHADLVEGGEEILNQSGELGQALFSAALGTVRLREVLEDLNATADGLFRPRGSKPSVNALLREYKEALKKTKEATLSASAWSRIERDIRALDGMIEASRRDLEQVQTVVNRLQRVKRVLRLLGILDTVLEELRTLEDAVELPEDFAEQRRTAREKLRQALEAQAKLALKIEDTRGQLEALEVDEKLLARAAEVRVLSEQLGAYKKSKRDLPGQEAKYRQKKNEAREALRSFRPGMALEDADALKPQFARRKVIFELIDRDRELTAEERSNEKQLRNLVDKIERITHKLSEQPRPADPARLAAAVATAREVGDIDKRIADKRSKARTLAETCDRALKRLGQWEGDLAGFEHLALPLAETVDRFEDRFSELESEAHVLRQKRADLEKTREEKKRQLDELRAGGEVPTREQLEEVRAYRARGWHLVRRAWLEGEDVEAEARQYDPGRPLPDAFEHSVQVADDVADRMYQEVERVERHHAITVELRGAKASLESVDQDLEENRQRRENLEREWTDVWQASGIVPLTPREMRAWLAGAEALRQHIGNLRTLNHELEQLEQSRDAERKALLTALSELAIEPPPSDDAGMLAPLRGFAEKQLGAIETRLKARRELQSSMNDAEADLKMAKDDARDLRARRERWREAWRAAVAWLELPGEPSPAEVSAALEQLEAVFTPLKEADDQERRIWGIKKDLEEFEGRVRTFVSSIDLPLDNLEPDLAVEKLLEATAAAEKALERRKALEEQLRKLEAEHRELDVDIQTAKTRLEELRKQAGAATEEDVDRAEQRSSRRRELRKRKEELLQQIQDNGDGYPVDRLREEASGKNIDALPGEIEEKRRLAGELSAKLDELKAQRAELVVKRDAVTGSGAAAETRERANQLLAQMRSEVARYLRARAAAHMLEVQIERFRRENQTPLLARASQLFSKLTLGAYKGLRDDVDKKRTPIVLGVRPDDREVPVEGMSDGTRDQLFLSLRLAALERHLEDSEPMPFVVDDILIGFDDERSRGALEVFGELASRTQVVLFTHHARVVELARELEPMAGVIVHELEAGVPGYQ